MASTTATVTASTLFQSFDPGNDSDSDRQSLSGEGYSIDNFGGDDIVKGVNGGALATAVVGGDENDKENIADAFDDNEDDAVEDDDYAMSVLSTNPGAVASITVAVVGGGEGDKTLDRHDNSTPIDIAIDPMTTREPPHTVEKIDDEDWVTAEHSTLDDHSSSMTSNTAASVAGGMNAAIGEVVSDGTAVATATITCTDDDDIIDTKDYDLVKDEIDNSNKLVRLLRRRPNVDVEREARKEEMERVAANARKWNEWMVSGRKISNPPLPSSSALESSTSELSSPSPSSVEGGDSSSEATESEAATTTMTKITSVSSLASNEVVAFDESSSEKSSDENTISSVAITASPPPDVVVADRSVAALGGKSPQMMTAMKIREIFLQGFVVNRFAGRVKAMMQRRSDQEGDNMRKLVRTKVAAARVREPGRISASDWRANIINLPNSTILRDVRDPVTWIFVWATLWSIVYECLTRLVARGASASASREVWSWWGGGVAATTPSEAGWVLFAAWASRRMCLPTLTHSMMVSAMSLLLVFRTNSAYQRFAEGRWVYEFNYFYCPPPPSYTTNSQPVRAQSLATLLNITMNDNAEKYGMTSWIRRATFRE